MSSSKILFFCFLLIQLVQFDALFSMKKVSLALDFLEEEKEFDEGCEHSDHCQLPDFDRNSQEVSAWSTKNFVDLFGRGAVDFYGLAHKLLWSSTESNMDLDCKELYSHPTQIFSSLKKNIDHIESLDKESQKKLLILFGAFIFMFSMDICSNPERDDPDATDRVVAFIRNTLATLERKHNDGHSLPLFSELKSTLQKYIEDCSIEEMEYEPSWVVKLSGHNSEFEYSQECTKYEESDLLLIKKVRMWAKKILTSFVKKATCWEDLID